MRGYSDMPERGEMSKKEARQPGEQMRDLSAEHKIPLEIQVPRDSTMEKEVEMKYMEVITNGSNSNRISDLSYLWK